jgi:hypothetical protein
MLLFYLLCFYANFLFFAFIYFFLPSSSAAAPHPPRRHNHHQHSSKSIYLFVCLLWLFTPIPPPSLLFCAFLFCLFALASVSLHPCVVLIRLSSLRLFISFFLFVCLFAHLMIPLLLSSFFPKFSLSNNFGKRRRTGGGRGGFVCLGGFSGLLSTV